MNAVADNVPSRVVTPAEQHEARELQDRVTELGATPIGSLRRGEAVVVAGTVRSVTLRPATDTMRFEVDLYDGTGRMTLVWLGRRRIAALNVGRFLIARGRVTETHGRPCIYNPIYELQGR